MDFEVAATLSPGRTTANQPLETALSLDASFPPRFNNALKLDSNDITNDPYQR